MSPVQNKRRLIYLFVIMALVLMVNLLSWGLARWLLLGDLQRLEQEHAQVEFVRVAKAFEREGAFLSRWAASRAVRIRALMQEPGSVAERIQAHLPWTLLEAADIDLVSVQFNEGGRQITLFSTALTDAQHGPGNEQLISQVSRQLSSYAKAVNASGYIALPAGIAVCAVEPLDRDTPELGSLLVMRLMDADSLGYLLNLLQAEVRLTAWPPTGAEEPSAHADMTVALVGDDHLKITAPLPPLSLGSQVGIELLLPRLVYPQAVEMVRYYQLWLAGLSVIAGLVGWPLTIRLRTRQDQERLLNRMIRDSGEALLLARPNGRIVLCNPQAAQMFGTDVGRLPGQRLDDLLGSSGDKRNWMAVLNSVQEHDEHPLLVCFQNALGRLVFGEVVVSSLTFMEEEHLLLQIRDVSRRVAAEEALRAASERYRLLFDTNPMPMWVSDRETLQFLEVNEAAVQHYGYSREEFLAMTIKDIRPEEEVPRLLEAVKTVGQDLTRVGIWRHLKKDGSLIDVDITVYPVEFDGRSASLTLLNDVTEQEQLRQDAERVGRLAALGELAAGVAHEINNPNGMILRNLDFVGAVVDDALPLLADRAREEDLQLGGLDYELVCAQVPQLIDDMQRGAGHIRDIVRDMKDFARFDEPTSQANLELNEAVAAAVRLLDGVIRKTTDSFAMELASQLPTTLGNTRQIEQVVLNLLMNACQSLPDRSHSVVVATGFDAKRNRLLVEVIDQGRGIAENDLARIADPFFTTRREQGGTGLGLSVSTRIVKQHGGTLHFKSKLGQGTHVTLALPVRQRDSEIAR